MRRMRVLAAVMNPEASWRILEHFGLSLGAPPLARSRLPDDQWAC